MDCFHFFEVLFFLVRAMNMQVPSDVLIDLDHSVDDYLIAISERFTILIINVISVEL